MYINGFVINKTFLYRWHTGHTRRFGKGINTDFVRDMGSLYPVSDSVLVVRDLKGFTLREYTTLLVTDTQLQSKAIEVQRIGVLQKDNISYCIENEKRLYLSVGNQLLIVKGRFGRLSYLTFWGAKVRFNKGVNPLDCIQ